MTVPLATYRVQLHAGFGFDAAANIADYLHELGVSHLYCSPYLQAGAGSTHGYDVLDHGRVNEELGGAEGHAHLCRTLGEQQLGQILDIVPNHMSIASRENRWWWDVLENGPSSTFAAYFDVDWQAPEAKLHNMVLLPILGDHFGRILATGEVQIQRQSAAFTFHYHDHVMPVAPRSLSDLLNQAASRVDSADLAFIADSFGNLPLSTATDRASVERRHRDKEVLRRLLARLCEERPEVAATIDDVVRELNASPEALGALLDRQNFRLAFWRSARQDLDYRRFFDINTLISLRMEDERVFQDTHSLVLEWARMGVVDGLRVDHPDGLRDPTEYFERVRKAAPGAWIIVEKILEPGEQLPEYWPIAGTTGYDFLNQLAAVFVDPEGEQPLSEFYARFTGETATYQSLMHDKKHLVLRELFGSDVSRLTSLLVNICEMNKRYRDYTRRELNSMLREVIACFPVYRTYVQANAGRTHEADVRYVEEAIDAARRYRPEIDEALFDYLRDMLLLRVRGQAESEFVMRFQQTTGPVMAKGVEDTVFYNYNRLVALNEVGGDPGRFGISLDEFHEACASAQARWPEAMLASTTHDTKRSEDVRARLLLLAETPQTWCDAVERWSALSARYKREGVPDRNAEYLLYQTLVGAWPLPAERAVAYMTKASREAKAATSWTDPNLEYDAALEAFVRGLLSSADFLSDLEQFVGTLVEPGRINSLAQALVKLTAPGVPDIYQGNELWDLSLVDPDNRRPVDYDTRRRLLAELPSLSPNEIWRRADEGLPKLWLTRQALRVRRRFSKAFGAAGGYQPLSATGAKQQLLIAFRRADECITIAPRFPLRLQGDWEGTTLEVPAGTWHNELTGEDSEGGITPVARLLARFPVALLTRLVE